ncbi:carboxypeptidase inhibitor SmCI-like [Rhipicephalus microplus]|uniref:carboxypeptidase inhibitor SmCI-like n=1 Tax=Rhipicephalus microplus TaxID=6941 RepID=UPI003F6AA946
MLRKSKLIFVCIYYSQLLGLWNTAHGSIDITTMKPKKCMKVPFIGLCHPLVGAWYYNYQTGACVKLPSGICAGGGNLFLTQKKCMQECHILSHKTSKTCLALPVIGQCGPIIVSYYYDSQANHCKAFNRTLCGGGGNSFVTEIQCLTTCRPNKKPEPRCSVSPKAGRCFIARKYYYFDETKNDCFLFPNKKCGSNRNAFSSYKSCKQRCSYNKAALPCATCGQQISNQLPSGAFPGPVIPPGSQGLPGQGFRPTVSGQTAHAGLPANISTPSLPA